MLKLGKFKEVQLPGLTVDSEKAFYDILLRERKRSERSNRPILLLLLDISKLTKGSKSTEKRLFNKLAGAIEMSTRDIDIKGWYRRRKIIGIIYSEIKESGVNFILNKICQNLLTHLEEKDFSRVFTQFLTFPQLNSANGEINISRCFYSNKGSGRKSKGLSEVSKRMMDIVGALAGIVLFFPFFMIIPVAIRLTSKGPVIFKQKRIGKGGKVFNFLKFRSMYTNSDSTVHREYVRNLIKEGDRDTGGIKKLTRDTRITPLGAFLRKTSFDEIPQFFNVLKGDMSMVGPRPAIPYEVEDYDIWHKRRLYEIKPGLTGIWQVAGRSKTTFNEMVRMDIQYMESNSVLKDLQLIFQTPLAMVSTRGAL